ncbi:hypothetical protein K439DRAFT_1373602 [Ramaria rubella]|nr:hypothetical protein K439DRAFT_1373602 [Ramaria rubella]
MWVAHFAPGLTAKPFVPNVPIWVLALAGALPDALHFVLNLMQIESFNFDNSLVRKSCLPYSNDYPFTHSLMGMVIAGLVYIAIYTHLAGRRVTLRDQGVLLAVVLSHFFLELPVHRKDVKITPGDDAVLGVFDYSLALFTLEMGILLTGFVVWNAASPPSAKAGAVRKPWLPKALLLFFTALQVHFCFGSAPTSESRFVHAPIFLGEILLSVYLLAQLDEEAPRDSVRVVRIRSTSESETKSEAH